MNQRSAQFFRDLVNVRGELLLLKRAQRRLDERLELLLQTQAGLASLLHEHRNLLQELHVSDARAAAGPRELALLKKAA